MVSPGFLATEADRQLSAHLDALRQRGIRPGLDTMERMLGSFGNPHLDQPTVLVAGTNGKGSTAALLASMARAAGYRVGLYTSPHLEHVSDVLSLAGPSEEVPTGLELASCLAEVVRRGEALALPLTPFEALTLAALRVMARHPVDLAVVEAGLGGRLDATNVCQPRLSIVTSVELDHQCFLGEDRATIAEHKAGVFRPSSPAIIGWCGDVEKLLHSLALEARAEPVLASEEIVGLEADPSGPSPRWVEILTRSSSHRLRLPLAGAHQERNLALAVLAAERLARSGFPRLDGDAIARGSLGVRWPGRLEAVTPGFLLDTAHNPAAARALLAELERRGEPFDLLFGALADKDALGMLEILAPAARRIVLTAPDDPRAWNPYEAVAGLTSTVSVVPRLDEALCRQLANTNPGKPLVLVTGSLRLVGQARSWLRQHSKQQPKEDPTR